MRDTGLTDVFDDTFARDTLDFLTSEIIRQSIELAAQLRGYSDEALFSADYYNAIMRCENEIADKIQRGGLIGLSAGYGYKSALHFLLEFPRGQWDTSDALTPALKAIVDHDAFQPIAFSGLYLTYSETAMACKNPNVACFFQRLEEEKAREKGVAIEDLRERVMAERVVADDEVADLVAPFERWGCVGGSAPEFTPTEMG